MALTRNQLKFITQLQQKKYRFSHGLFLAEGVKVVSEFLNSDFKLHSLYTTRPDRYQITAEIHAIDERDLKKISTYKTPNEVVAVFHIPESESLDLSGLTIALDGVNDPGNLGTIIRLCDWFGVKTLVCSSDTVDCYNQKVVQASMGSMGRLHIWYGDLPELLESIDIPIYGMVMDGNSIYKESFQKDSVLIFGNEANGIRPSVLRFVTGLITIPRFGADVETESLNVAMAAAIGINEFRRS